MSSVRLPGLCDVTKAIDKFSITRTVSLVTCQITFDTKKNIRRSNSAFSWLVSLVKQQTDKSLGGSGGIPSKIFSQRISTNWKNSQKRKWGSNFSLLPPLAAPLLLNK